tara:strand:+ start:143 stop:367 length:225 start_codon:yes stop_codon:yes gene_type:complete
LICNGKKKLDFSGSRLYNVYIKSKNKQKESNIMTHVEKIENLTKYLMESEGYTELQAKFEAIRVLMEIQLNKRK